MEPQLPLWLGLTKPLMALLLLLQALMVPPHQHQHPTLTAPLRLHQLPPLVHMGPPLQHKILTDRPHHLPLPQLLAHMAHLLQHQNPLPLMGDRLSHHILVNCVRLLNFR